MKLFLPTQVRDRLQQLGVNGVHRTDVAPMDRALVVAWGWQIVQALANAIEQIERNQVGVLVSGFGFESRFGLGSVHRRSPGFVFGWVAFAQRDTHDPWVSRKLKHDSASNSKDFQTFCPANVGHRVACTGVCQSGGKGGGLEIETRRVATWANTGRVSRSAPVGVP